MLSPGFALVAAALSHTFTVYELAYHQNEGAFTEQDSNGFGDTFEKTIQTKTTVAYVTIADVFIEPKRAPQQIQTFKTFLKNHGMKSSIIVLNLSHCRFEGNKISVASLFLQTLFIENIIRDNKGFKPFQLYFHVASKIFKESDENLHCLDKTCFDDFLYNYLTYSRTISGIVLDSSLITDTFSKKLDVSVAQISSIWTRILKMKEFTKQVKQGNELKVGIIIHSLEECVRILKKLPNYVLPELDIAVYNEKHYKWIGSSAIAMDRANNEKGFEECNQILLSHFSQPPVYKVKEFYF